MHKLVLKSLLIFSFISVLFSCGNSKDRTEDVDLSEVKEVKVEISRYEQALFSMDPDNIEIEIKEVANEFPQFLQGDLSDSLNIMQLHDFISDPTILRLYEDCQNVFPTLENLEKEFSEAFRYYLYYFPKDTVPEVITYVSGGDFEHPVKYINNQIIVALDMYLEQDYPMYSMWGIPEFASYTMDEEYILADAMYEIAVSKVPFEKADKSLLEMMVYYGKLYYFVDAMMPELGDSIIIGYTPTQTDWIIENEGNVWGFFVDKELLYSTDHKKINSFLSEGPFTSAFSKESPATIARWIGWRIVKKYMNENEQIELSEMLLQNDAQAILSKSRYKPEKTE